jgi:hypothetical protein
LLIRHFGEIIRADAAGDATCEPHNAPSYKIVEVIEKVIGIAPPNAWMGFEINLIAMGADWYDGVTYVSKVTTGSADVPVSVVLHNLPSRPARH